MKKLLLLLLLIPFLGTSQGTFTAPVGYNTGAPTAAPSGVGTRWRFDLLTGKKYTWNPDAMAWDEDPRGIDQISGCSAPMYTPGYNQSTFAVNSCSTPELYQYYSSAWHCLNCGGGTNISAGSGITLSGTAPDITISADDNSPTNELQTLSIDGSDLTLSDGGGTVTIPGGSSLGVGFTDGGGSGTIPMATATFDATSILFGVDAADQFKVANTNTSDPGSEANLEIVSGTVNFYVKAGSEDRSVTMNAVPGALNFEARNSDMNFNASRSLATINLISTPATLVFSNPDANVIFTDNRDEAARFGIEYAAEYPEILDHDRSFLDVGLAKQLINSKDPSSTNEIQTLSISGHDLSLSLGGGTVTLPSGGGSPGGSNTYVQYNGLGSFAADNSFRFNNDTVSVDILRLPKTNAALDSGAIWIGTGMLPVLYRYNPPGATGGNIFVGGSGNTTMHVDTNAVQSSHNTIVGELSFGSNTIGYFNQVVGYQSLDQGRWAAGSCVLGSRALRYADGHDNIAVGDNSGYNIRSGRENINIGYQANYHGRNYSNCIFIGRGSGAAEADSVAAYYGSVAIGADTRVTKSYQVVLGTPGTTETILKGTIITDGAIQANFPGGNIRMKADGTDAKDGGLFVNAAGNIWLGSWNLDRGWKVNASGSIEQLGSYTLQTGRIGVNTAPHATAALNVSGASIYSGQVDFNAVGGQFRLKADGTTNLDGGIIVTAPGVMYLTNWGLTRGFVVSPTGNIEVRGGPMTVGGTTADASAKLEVVSTTQGFLPPRMTTGQRNAIASPATGLTLYCTDCTATDASTGVMQTYNGSAWKNNW